MSKTRDEQHVICEKLRKLGYASEQHVRLYGEEFYLVSDPVPEGDGFAVKGIARRSGKSRHIRIPLSTVDSLRREVIFDNELEIAA
jgi:hypothetical protein